MGIPLVPTGKMFDCNKCGAIIDASGYHALTCKSGGDLIHRHNTIRDTIGKACQMAGWNPRLEKPGWIANTNDRPADIYIPSLTNGKSCAADVAVTHALQPISIKNAAKVAAGAATRYATAVKDHKYKEVLAKQDYGIDYLPLVVDCFGAWDERAVIFFKKIASSISKMKFKSYAETINQLMEKISVCLMRANARTLLKRLSTMYGYDEPTLITASRTDTITFLGNNF